MSEDDLKVWTKLFCAALGGVTANAWKDMSDDNSLVSCARDLADMALAEYRAKRDLRVSR